MKPSRDFKVTTEDGRSSLLIAEVFPDDAGVYGVKATNKAGQASTTATLKVISTCFDLIFQTFTTVTDSTSLPS